MHDRLDDRTRHVLRLADLEAQRFGHDHIGTEHLLLALLREGNNPAARLLAQLGVELRKVRLLVETDLPAAPAKLQLGVLPRTPGARRALEAAVEEAGRAGALAGPEHLLLGLLREEDGVAAHLLAALGLSGRDVRAGLLGEPGLFPPATQVTGEAPSAPPADDTIRRAQEVDHLQGAPPADLELSLPDLQSRIVRQEVRRSWWGAFLRFLGLAPPLPPPTEPLFQEPPRGKRFTNRAREVFQKASGEAWRMNHEYIGTEHLLLGLLSERGVVAGVLLQSGLDPETVRREVLRIVQYGPPLPSMPASLPWTPRSLSAIAFALDEARLLGDERAGTEHLLLGLLGEQEGVAAQVLMNLGLRQEAARALVRRLLGRDN